MSEATDRLYEAFVSQDPAAAISVIESVRESGIDRDRLFDEAFAPAMARLGQAWATKEIDEMAFTQAAVVAEQITSFVLPRAAVADTGVTIVVGCVDGEMHSIGRNMVVAALKEAGHRVIDLGVDVSPARFLEKVEETGARLLVACAEMTAAAANVGRVREMLEAAGHDEVLVLASGGPFDADPGYARRLGANGVIRGAEGAVKVVARIVEERLGGER
jgi:methanogenic corrinoid protein MtbC1